MLHGACPCKTVIWARIQASGEQLTQRLVPPDVDREAQQRVAAGHERNIDAHLADGGGAFK